MCELEKVAEGDFDSVQYKTYKTSCMCNDPSCDLMLDLERTDGDISLTIYKTLSVQGLLWKRIKIALTLLFMGEITTEGVFLFRSKIHASDFAYTILSFCKEQTND